MDVIGFVKERPVMSAAIGGGALLILVFAMSSGGGGGGGTNVTVPRPSDAEIAAGTQLQLAQLSMQNEATRAGFQLQGLQEQIGGQIAIEGLRAQTSLAGQEAAIAGQIAIEGQRISAQQTIELSRMQSDIERTALIQASAVQLAEIQTSGMVAQSAIFGDVQKAMAQYQSETAIAQARSFADVAKTQAKYSAQSNMFGSALGFLGGLF